MKKLFLPFLILVTSLFTQPAFSQSEGDTASLGLPGDNLDLYGVLTLFQSSKTIEAFEKSLNEQKTGLNNLDLDLDGKVDFIKLVLIAILIATPVAWYAMNEWLHGFAYRMDISVWVFVLAGCIALAIAVLTISYQSIKSAIMNPVYSLRSE